jgi:pimeloyl-ACP methyl ester carboxylesterase
MTRRRTAVLTAGIAAGAVAAGTVGAAVRRRRREHQEHAPVGALPPEILERVRSFDGTEIVVRAAGDPGAPVLLFAHGFSLDLSTWSEQWPALSAAYRCVLMDHRSHGASGSAADGDLTLRAMGRDIAAVLDAVSPEEPAILIGHSMGAMAILALAELRPELFGPRVVGVVLIGAASGQLIRGAMGSVTELLRPRLGSLRAAAGRVDRLRRAVLASPADVGGVVARVTQFGPDAPRNVVDHVVNLAGRASSQVWTDGLAGLMEMDLRHALPRVTVPALVVVGEHDRVTPPAAAVELAGALPHGELTVLPRAGHIAMLERPDELNRALERFASRAFARVDAPSEPKPKPKPKPKRSRGVDPAGRPEPRRSGASRSPSTGTIDGGAT